MKSSLFFLFVFLVSFNIFSQNNYEDYILQTPSKSKSFYSKINVIDARIDTANMGFVQKGAFNRRFILQPKLSLKKQIETVFSNMIESVSTENELFLNLKEYKFAEITGAFEETGYCYLKADLFIKKENGYQKIDSINVVSKVGAMDVTNKNIKNGSDKLLEFLTKNMTVAKEGKGAIYEEIKNIDFIEKRKIPMYNTKEYINGVYITFDDFKKQVVSFETCTLLKNKKGKITKVVQKYPGESDVTIDSKFIYAVANEGKIYLSTSNGFVPLEFRDDDFYFNGSAKVSANTGDVVMATVFFGVIGGIIASDTSAEFLFKIDYLDGTPIQLNKL